MDKGMGDKKAHGMAEAVVAGQEERGKKIRAVENRR